ncbi:MAG: tRNA lysidine(34) synthetase TilS [Syntrophomonadaceae bacterium]|nr:tRNA lysidine(34) synthetase TilS [Syntrophomonadaceae bacterium]MDD4562230.1 tRNA lysidine(34) synthetase TilS [Syntrophomonadaceae bacterium]
MLAKVSQYIREQNLITPGDLVVAGTSGGPDSMALLHILIQLCPRLNFKLVVAHLNHGLRPEAAAEEKFVRDYCQIQQIPFYSRQADVQEMATREKKSLEEAGRDCRYQYFAELAAELGATRIATAHHQDDNAETVLLNIIRGSGIKGLRGIRPVNGIIIRPLLCVDKNEIESYLAENSIEYCIDLSNYSTDYLRNRIRHNLLPLLEQDYNPRMVNSLNQLADIAAAENDAMENETAHFWEELIIKQEAGEIILNIHAILELHPAFQRRIILKTLSAIQGENSWNATDVKLVTNLLNKPGSSKRLQLKQGLYVKKVYGHIIFTRKLPKKTSFSYKVTVPGQVYIKETGKSFSFQLIERKDFKPQVDDCYLDYDKIKGEPYLRSRQPGDVFCPRGMQGTKKIKDFFIDLKVPQADRDQVPLLVADQKTYAILGFRIAQDAAVDNNTRRILLISIHNS